MKLSHQLVFALICGAVLVLPTGLRADDSPGDSVTVDSLLEHQIALVEDAVAAKDIGNTVAVLTDSAEVSIYGRSVTGRENARTMLEFFMTRFVDVTITVSTDSLLLSEDTVRHVGTAIYTLKWPMMDAGAWRVPFEANWHRVAEGVWKIARLEAPRNRPEQTEQ